ncbi:Uncharacterized protein Adt_36323 [Abeliophyllum distichum]|uniref:Transposase n=1 Tax=Abeliophyllum distichum TaxID=126358 RepID=A0ABD1QH89_9LAMI
MKGIYRVQRSNEQFYHHLDEIFCPYDDSCLVTNQTYHFSEKVVDRGHFNLCFVQACLKWQSSRGAKFFPPYLVPIRLVSSILSLYLSLSKLRIVRGLAIEDSPYPCLWNLLCGQVHASTWQSTWR